jgi:hypothetical protein
MTDVPDAKYTSNVNRSIWVRGEINKSLLEGLQPQVLDLTSRSRAPITVFIGSPGGNAAVGERIMSLLRSADQDGEPACRIIAVALSKAQSAAADLLSAGDFAIRHAWELTAVPRRLASDILRYIAYDQSSNRYISQEGSVHRLEFSTVVIIRPTELRQRNLYGCGARNVHLPAFIRDNSSNATSQNSTRVSVDQRRSVEQIEWWQGHAFFFKSFFSSFATLFTFPIFDNRPLLA